MYCLNKLNMKENSILHFSTETRSRKLVILRVIGMIYDLYSFFKICCYAKSALLCIDFNKLILCFTNNYFNPIVLDAVY